EIKERITRVGKETDADVVITEIGGTVGDIESQPFMEAIRQLKGDLGKKNVFYLHCTLVPYIKTAGELKTKPTQHSLKELRGIGIQPDSLICRSDRELTKEVKDKISLFGDIEKKAVIQVIDADHIYEVPLMLEREGLAEIIIDKLEINDKVKKPDLLEWKAMVQKMKEIKKEITIAIVGKYVELPDTYLSISESLSHAGVANSCMVNIKFIYSEDLEKIDDLDNTFKNVERILVPGGFGQRGIEGKIKAIQYARKNKVPYFGICLGMQCAVIEFSRNILGLKEANSAEFDPQTPYPVIDLMPEQKDIEDMGGTMRLGIYPCKLEANTLSRKLYNDEIIYERHRHRYELNNQYRNELKNEGMVMAGISPDQKLVEIIEITDHPWFVGTQFHPEFKSRPNRPHPLFIGFVKAALKLE
ncbi:MAG: CTP synthase, partial [Halanaerobiales bacterium]|nr:CTP synthase [Halanaerobiales bacterium]